jgi:2'-5' RNA ligase
MRSVLRRALGAGRGESALVVPLPESEPLVGPWRERHDPAARAGMPAHVTLLYPFLAPREVDAAVEQALEEVVASRPAFPFSLERVGRFPGVLYLAPEPAEPFVELTEALVERWPGCPPYGGQFDSIVPHLTVAIGDEPPELAAALERGLPLHATAREVALMARRFRRPWSTVDRVRLREPDGA